MDIPPPSLAEFSEIIKFLSVGEAVAIKTPPPWVSDPFLSVKFFNSASYVSPFWNRTTDPLWLPSIIVDSLLWPITEIFFPEKSILSKYVPGATFIISPF